MCLSACLSVSYAMEGFVNLLKLFGVKAACFWFEIQNVFPLYPFSIHFPFLYLSNGITLIYLCPPASIILLYLFSFVLLLSIFMSQYTCMCLIQFIFLHYHPTSALIYILVLVNTIHLLSIYLSSYRTFWLSASLFFCLAYMHVYN